ncbi:MAG: membrane protein insertase YidC [Alphaproteobacteria bacterium]|nr:membrane protein insertase YidC [Alphaproteobacteria bacterium]
MSDDLKSFCTAVILSVFVVLGVNYFFPKENPEQITTGEETKAEETAISADTDETAQVIYTNADEVLQQDERLPLKNEVLEGSIRLKGARFDNLSLLKYKQTLDVNSANVVLFNPAKTQDSYFAEYGWLSGDTTLILPDANTVWNVIGNQKLTPQTPVTLEWDNGQGIKFINQISMDENYLFSLKQSVENNSEKAITIFPYGLLSKQINPENMSRSVVHEGFTGIVNDDLKEVQYAKIDEKGENYEANGGWISFNDKYWFSSFVFNNAAKLKINLRKIKDNTFQLDFKGLPIQVQAGSSASFTSDLYAGAKEIKLLDKYSSSIKKFDLNIDFGWYYFITKPFFYILDFLYGLIGNMGWAILLFAAFLRLMMFPIANKSYESMSKMKKIQPKIMAIQEMYKNDKAALQRATMALYQKEKVNPASGCLPLFIQIPIFFSLYKVLNIAIEIRHAPFIGWVKDLSAPDPLTISVWSHIPYIPSLLDIGVWPLIYGLTMLLQNKLNPKPANKDQARMFMLMPIVFTLMFAHFAVGLVIYWTLNNVLSLIQQKVIMRKNGVQ